MITERSSRPTALPFPVTGVSCSTLIAVAALSCLPGLASPQSAPPDVAGSIVATASADDAPTYSRDVAPIIQGSCQQCHRPDGIGPMSLLTYEQTLPFAPLIRYRVEQRIMPPWHLDRTVGIQEYKNDISLSDAEIETIVRWADAGAPEGDPADLPPPIEFPPAYEWELETELGPPDFVVRSKPFSVVANGQDQWWDHSVQFEGLPEARWIKAAEFKPVVPTGRKGRAPWPRALRPGRLENRVGRDGVGKRWDKMPEGSASCSTQVLLRSPGAYTISQSEPRSRTTSSRRESGFTRKATSPSSRRWASNAT